MTTALVASLREGSRIILGNRYRAELIWALCEAGEPGVCIGDLAKDRQTRANVYAAPLKALLEAGLAERLPRVEGERRLWYRRKGDTALWRALGQMVEQLSGYGSPEATGAEPGSPGDRDDGRG